MSDALDLIRKRFGWGRFIQLVIIAAAVVVIVNWGVIFPSNSADVCETAVAEAASISDFEDGVGGLDGAIRECDSFADFEAAARLHPAALDGVEAEVFVRNRCEFGEGLGETAVCWDVAQLGEN